MHDATRTGTIIVVCLFAILLLAAVAFYLHLQQQKALHHIAVHVSEQKAKLVDIAERTDSNAADPIAVSIIRDCSQDDRHRFDQFLDRLSELAPSVLEEVQSLFNACAHVFPARKAVMVAHMEREYEVYRDLVQLQEAIGDTSDHVEPKLDSWEQLVQLEKERGRLFAEQLAIQQRIIDALRAGDRADSENISRELTAARAISDEAQTLDHEIDSLRAALEDI